VKKNRYVHRQRLGSGKDGNFGRLTNEEGLGDIEGGKPSMGGADRIRKVFAHGGRSPINDCGSWSRGGASSPASDRANHSANQSLSKNNERGGGGGA